MFLIEPLPGVCHCWHETGDAAHPLCPHVGFAFALVRCLIPLTDTLQTVSQKDACGGGSVVQSVEDYCNDGYEGVGELSALNEVSMHLCIVVCESHNGVEW